MNRWGVTGWFGVAVSLDDFGHRRLPRRLHRVLLGWLCDALDRRLIAEPER